MFSSQFQPPRQSFDRFPPRVEPYQVVVMIDDRGRMLAVSIGTGVDLRNPAQPPADTGRNERTA
ncbi:MAG: hypothetical protein ABGY75_06530 [Gemmataceae bacterium]